MTTISAETRRELLRYFHCDPERVKVIPNPVSDEFRSQPRRFNADYPRILQIGTKPNKNIERIARALEGKPCRLVIVGPLTKAQDAILNEYGIDFENHVNLPRDKLLNEYAVADMVLFVSLYEGFGLPIVEAQAIGRPVVTSDKAPMNEVAGAGACLVDPLDIRAIRAGIDRVIEDHKFRSEIIALGLSNVTRFRAVAVARQYADLYRKVAHEVGCEKNRSL